MQEGVFAQLRLPSNFWGIGDVMSFWKLALRQSEGSPST
jgi:hypothetical protein